MKKPQNFSIIIATYTGADTIDLTFNSLLVQQSPRADYEVVLVIDGPSDILKQKAENAQEVFQKKHIPFTIEQLTANKGRFEARLAGATMAKHQYILIVDDRVELPNDFLAKVSELGEEAVIPDVKEKEAKNFVSLTLNRLRRKIYGNRWNSNFKPYYIDKANFDSSPKGTTALWVNRHKFISACEDIASQSDVTANVNEDTRVLRYLVENDVKLYKISHLKIEYKPRSTAKSELVHIYKRGPRFIDYYLHPGTRYFWPIIGIYLLILPIIVLIILWPTLLIVPLTGLLLISSWIATNLKEWLRIFAGLGFISIFFGTGLIAGLIKKVM